MRRGFFITFEGPDGSGKTTQLALLEQALRNAGQEVLSLRQPGSTGLGDRIRSIVLDSRTDATLGCISPLAELALMFADRAQAISQVIRPALAREAIVLCDRFTDSSEAYQGGGRQLGAERVLALDAALCDGVKPDLTFLLLPPLAVSLERARLRNREHQALTGTDENRFEREGDAFYQRIHEAYEAIAAREPQRVIALRDAAPIAELAAMILTTVNERLEYR